MSAQMLDVLSVEDEQGNPVFNNCTLQLGELALEFKNGRAKVPPEHAPEVLRHPQVSVPGYDGPAAPPVPNVAASLPATTDPSTGREISEEERELRLAQARDYLRSQGLPVPEAEAATPSTADRELEALRERVAELETMLEHAVDLGDKGQATKSKSKSTRTKAEPEPKAEPALPEGFEATLPDGNPRCHVAKADGSQCSNPALEDSVACRLPAHQKKIAQ